MAGCAAHPASAIHALLTVMATSGVRAGDLVSMNLRELDLGRASPGCRASAAWRKVFLSKATVQAIQAYLRERPAGQEHALWLNSSDEPLTIDGVRQLVDRLAKRAGIKGCHNLHAFRHRAGRRGWIKASAPRSWRRRWAIPTSRLPCRSTATRMTAAWHKPSARRR